MTELLVLGSGGPLVNPRRASSGYVLSTDTGSRVLLDAGGGAFERLGRSGIGASQLDLVLLTHLHIDHSGGLAPVVFSAFLEGRTETLTVVGPTPRGGLPGVGRFCEALFGADGAWSYLHSFDGFGIRPVETSSELEGATARAVIDHAGVSVVSVAVPHGEMPAVAYRVECDGHTIVHSGDVQSAHPPLVELADGCDLLIHPLALPERETENGHLFAKPSAVGRVARDSGCKRLLLTHVFPTLEGELDEAVALVRDSYDGELLVAEDLMRIAL